MSRRFDEDSRSTRHGLARVLSKLGYCSRSQAQVLIREGRVHLNTRLCRDPEYPVDLEHDRVEVDGKPVRSGAKLYYMLNKPRGLVTTRSDEQGRPTVYECFQKQDLPWLIPVGRLDQASEGLLLFSNDTAWADHIQAPASHLPKTYHVQIDCIADGNLCRKLMDGIAAEGGEYLAVLHASLLRQGTRNSWLEIVLDEGKNRQIRRLLEVLQVHVLRLIRVAIGPLQLGPLPKGALRRLSDAEVRALRG